MKKTNLLRKTATFLLAGAMLTGTVTAENAVDGSSNSNDQLEQRMAGVLVAYYSNDSYCTDNYSYGEKVPTFIYSDNSMQSAQELNMYPIYQNGQLKGYVKETIVSGTSYLSYSEEYVSDTAELSRGSYSFVVSENGSYAVANDKLICLDNCADSNSENSAIEALCNTYGVNSVSSTERTHEISVNCPYSVLSEEDITFSLNIPVWAQPSGSGLCWAGCVEAVGEYMTNNMSYSPSSIANQMEIGSGGASINQIKQALLSLYGISTESSTAIPSFSYLVYKIENGKPIIASLQSASAGHTMTIIGYGATASVQTIKVMDTLGGVYRTFELNNGVFSYTYNIEPFTWTSAIIPA